MELLILVITDSHEANGELEKIITAKNPDIILHAGDFSRNYDDIPSVKSQLDVLSRLNKPIYFVPGNVSVI